MLGYITYNEAQAYSDDKKVAKELEKLQEGLGARAEGGGTRDELGEEELKLEAG